MSFETRIINLLPNAPISVKAEIYQILVKQIIDKAIQDGITTEFIDAMIKLDDYSIVEAISKKLIYINNNLPMMSYIIDNPQSGYTQDRLLSFMVTIPNCLSNVRLTMMIFSRILPETFEKKWPCLLDKILKINSTKLIEHVIKTYNLTCSQISYFLMKHLEQQREEIILPIVETLLVKWISQGGNVSKCNFLRKLLTEFAEMAVKYFPKECFGDEDVKYLWDRYKIKHIRLLMEHGVVIDNINLFIDVLSCVDNDKRHIKSIKASIIHLFGEYLPREKMSKLAKQILSSWLLDKGHLRTAYFLLSFVDNISECINLQSICNSACEFGFSELITDILTNFKEIKFVDSNPKVKTDQLYLSWEHLITAFRNFHYQVVDTLMPHFMKKENCLDHLHEFNAYPSNLSGMVFAHFRATGLIVAHNWYGIAVISKKPVEEFTKVKGTDDTWVLGYPNSELLCDLHRLISRPKRALVE